MSPKRKYSFYIDDAHAEALKRIKERDGVLESEQIRRAIADWTEKKGVTVKAAPRRVLKTRRKA